MVGLVRPLLAAVVAVAVLVVPAAVPPPAQAAETTWPETVVHTIAGTNRFQTAAALSRAGWPDGATAVVLASGEDYPDALAASTLAGTVAGPLLLTPTRRLDPDALAELRRLAPGTVYVVGAVADPVVDALTADGYTVERVRGADRYHTAFAVAERAVELGADAATVLVASGEGFADALAASSVAAAFLHPVLLTRAEGGASLLRHQVAELGAGRTLVVGGTAALPDAAVAGLPGMERIAGRDRAGTAAALAERAVAAGLRGPPVLAGGDGFADGLAGGVFAGAARRAPLLLSARRQLSDATAAWLASNRPPAVTQVGGPAAVGGLTTCQVQAGQLRPWRCIEAELAAQGYNVGAVDGRIDHQSPWAVYALQKVAGLQVTGRFGEPEWQAMLAAPRRPPRATHAGRHVEVDIGSQLLLIFDGGRMSHAFSVSTGKPSTPTVRGSFSVYRKLEYRNASNMYKPIYFYNRYAIHGYPSVPMYPASAGCVRVYDPDQDFLWPKIPMGTPVLVYL